MSFLFLFSYVLLFHFDPIEPAHPSLHPSEILVIMFVSCMFIEEVRIVKERNEILVFMRIYFI